MIDTDTLATATGQTAKESSSSFQFSWEDMYELLIEWGTSLIIALAVLVLGWIIAKRVTKLTTRILSKKELDESLKSFLVSMVSISLKVLVVITALSQLGMEMTSFVALIGAAGLAIGMAFSGTLGNFAGGIMILIFRPYKVGDYIKAQGEEGIVKEIQIFNTVVLTVDNKTIIIPNGAMANGNITNFTKQETRRVDWKFGIGYGDNYDNAKNLITQFIEEDSKILKDPEPLVALVELGDSSVNITVRVWSKTEDYWEVYFRMNERVYKEFGDAGLNIPFPQMDVHVHNS